MSSVFDFLSLKGNFLSKRTFPNTPAMNNVVFCFMNMDLNFKSPRTKCHNVLHSFAYYSAERKLIKKDINASHRTFSGRFVNHIKLREKTDKKNLKLLIFFPPYISSPPEGKAIFILRTLSPSSN